MLELFRKYLSLRPPHVKHKRLFLYYKVGKCSSQPVGKNTMGKITSVVASYLKLPDVACYTGHCLRRSSATLLADAGVDITTIKRHAGWKSTTVAEGYVENSIENKTKIANQVLVGTTTSAITKTVNVSESGFTKQINVKCGKNKPTRKICQVTNVFVDRKLSRVEDEGFSINKNMSTEKNYREILLRGRFAYLKGGARRHIVELPSKKKSNILIKRKYNKAENHLVPYNESAGVLPQDDTLTLRGVTQRSGGQYACAASNTEGETYSAPLDLKIQCKYGHYDSLEFAPCPIVYVVKWTAAQFFNFMRSEKSET
ncbi:hypothetical protein NQ317_003426 [Molorchus minor]|uniref:Tyr recombinase domain-containing protein n=1 Tax=Molorchus minor TaxID=1323400 RepID=A0ABQ9JHI7_9CUCU|nr:hypothetical protein NQ317_003426 [Molorchus minor]